MRGGGGQSWGCAKNKNKNFVVVFVKTEYKFPCLTFVYYRLPVTSKRCGSKEVSCKSLPLGKGRDGIHQCPGMGKGPGEDTRVYLRPQADPGVPTPDVRPGRSEVIVKFS